MSASEVVANYDLLADMTVQMRNAAEQGAWDQLINIESQRTQLLAAIKSMDAVAKLDEASHQRKVQLIEKILADDAQIRNHTQVCMSQLQLSIESNSNELRLRQAYGI